jgi:hypothetical protein
MRASKEITKAYRFEIELDEHELSMLQATLGIVSLPEQVNKSFPEYRKDELMILYTQLRAILDG